MDARCATQVLDSPVLREPGVRLAPCGQRENEALAKRRTRLRVQLISARGVFDAAQRLARRDPAQALDDPFDDEPTPRGGEANDVGKERPAAPRGARRSAS